MKNLIFKPYLDMVKPLIHSVVDEGAGGSGGDDDDFDVSGITEKKEEEENEESTEESSSEDGSGDQAEADEGDESKGEEESDKGGDSGEGDSGDADNASSESDGDEGTEESDSKDESGTEGDNVKEETEGEDFFSDLNSAPDDGTVEDYKPLAEDLGLELEDPKSRKEFVEKVNGQIKEAQKKLDLSAFTDTSQRLIKFANEHGDVADFFTNPKISQYNSFLASSPEAKYAQVRQNQLARGGMDQEAIDAKIGEEMDELSTRELKDLADGYDGEIKTALNTEIVSLLGDKETQIAAAKSKAESEIGEEKQNLVKYVETQTDFMGLPLTAANKKGIINAINNGTFDLAVEQNPAASKFNAYMFSKFYDKFVQQSKESANNASKKGYKKGLDKGKGTAFNTDTKEPGAKGSGTKGRWDDLQDIE